MEIKVRGYGKSYRIQGLTESYNAGFDECNKMWKEKIQEKIAERKKKRDNAELTLTTALFERDINLLQELLGDEK